MNFPKVTFLLRYHNILLFTFYYPFYYSAEEHLELVKGEHAHSNLFMQEQTRLLHDSLTGTKYIY